MSDVVMRKSLRPLTLSRVIQVIELACKEGRLTEQNLIDALGVSKDRSKEILLEMVRMHILENPNSFYLPTEVARKILHNYEREDWKAIHELLLQNYDYYSTLVQFLMKSNNALTKQEILEELSKLPEFAFNNAAVDIMCDWAERLGRVQRNLYSDKYYYLSDESPSFENFILEVRRCYNYLNEELRPGIKLEYIEIARIREEVCQKLRIDREVFDNLFEKMFTTMIGKMELSGAPLTTSAKRIPTSLKIIERKGKEPILSPSYKTIKEGKGIEIDGKLYQYVALFDTKEVK